MTKVFFLYVLIDENDDQKLEICIYKTDTLQVNTRIKHPTVITYIVDTSTWEYLKKSEANRTNHVNTYIEPLLTKEFDFKSHK